MSLKIVVYGKPEADIKSFSQTHRVFFVDDIHLSTKLNNFIKCTKIPLQD